MPSLGSSAVEASDGGAFLTLGLGGQLSVLTELTFQARANCGVGLVSCWKTVSNPNFSTILLLAVVMSRVLRGFF